MVMEPKTNPTDAVVDDEVDETVVDMPSEETSQKDSTEPVMLTKEQADKLFDERQSKLDKRIFQLEQEGQKTTKALQAAEARANALEGEALEARKRADKAELESLGDSPDARSLFEARVAQREATAKLEREKAEWAEAVEEAKQYKITKLADNIAAADPDHPVDSSLLVTLTDGSKEAMERLAKVLPKKEPGDNIPNLTKPPKPDSGRGSGGSGPRTVEQLDKLAREDPDGYAEYVADRSKKK